MAVNNLFIFNRDGDCLFSFKPEESDKTKLIHGFLYSLRSFVNRISKDTSDEFMAYTTSTYQLVNLEIPTGLNIVLVAGLDTTRNNEQYKQLLRQFYRDIYVEFVVKNPVIKPNSVIDSKLFHDKVGEYFVAT